MNLSELAQYIRDEEKSEQALIEKGILKRYDVCPFCGEGRISRIRRAKYKCYRCNKEWGVRRDSILKGLRVPFTKFLMAIKFLDSHQPKPTSEQPRDRRTETNVTNLSFFRSPSQIKSRKRSKRNKSSSIVLGPR